jgi:hypothetical protein
MCSGHLVCLMRVGNYHLERKSIMKVQHALALAIACVAWVTFAEHPTARNLRAAVIKSVPLL